MRKPKPQWVTRADLARRAGVSRAAITLVCRGRLSQACTGDRVDLGHPSVVAYLGTRRGTTTTSPQRARPPRKRSGRPALDRRLDSPDPSVWDELDLAEPYASMTLRELVDRHGSRRAARCWLDSLHIIEQSRARRIANAQTESTRIARELVQTHVFGALEILHRRLVVELPPVLRARIYAAARSGATRERGEQMARELISEQLRAAKADALARLRPPSTTAETP